MLKAEPHISSCHHDAYARTNVEWPRVSGTLTRRQYAPRSASRKTIVKKSALAARKLRHFSTRRLVRLMRLVVLAGSGTESDTLMMKFVACALIVFISSVADAGAVLTVGYPPTGLFSDGLAQYGHAVTIGPHYDAFDGSIDLSPYDAIVFSAAFYADPDMPLLGQQSIVDFVTNGGGLITGEWTTWRNNATGAFGEIAPILPASTAGGTVGGARVEVSVRYAQVTSDPILNAGLPASMDFVINAAGTEIIYPKVGATVFYSGDSISPYLVLDESINVWIPYYESFPSAGLIGWQYGAGRVLSFSTTLQQPIGPDYTDNYSRLVANSIDWVSRPQAVPEPASLTLFGLGALGIAAVRRRRHAT